MLTARSRRLADWTTLRLGGPAENLVEVQERGDVYRAVFDADAADIPALVLGGGSNLVVSDDGFDGTVIRVASRGITVRNGQGAVEVTAEAGESWEHLVQRAVTEGWVGIEALAGIPGTVGAVPIQNVGAYGQEVADTITSVDVFDRLGGGGSRLGAAECGFGYRSSRFKSGASRFVIGAVTFRFETGRLATPVQYAELARTLGVHVGESAPLVDVSVAVLRLRTAKGMVLDADDHDTWSAGSFFTNPFVEPAAVPLGAPAFPQADGRVKTSAAWLIERAGFAKGFGNEKVRVSAKHTLALTNRGSARTSDLLALAREIRAGVRERFGIDLEPEPVLVGCSLD